MSAAHELPRRQILIGDAGKRLRELPAESVDCVITSPPYFAQRDYGVDGQLGAEASVQHWVRELVGVLAEVRRVLKPSGSVWLNVGDGYARTPHEGAQRKSLLLGPQRLAVALAEDGWLVRNHVIWAKRNPMPSSVRDRLTNAHETVLLLTRQPTYYFDLDAIRVPAETAAAAKQHRPRRVTYPPPASAPRLGHGQSARIDLNLGLVGGGSDRHPLGKNPSDVWWLSTSAYRGAHFAVFPAELVRRPLLATCPERLCPTCGSPWRRALQRLDGRLLCTGPLGPICACGQPGVPGVVLDPFLGSGTVAVVAEETRRDWLGIDLNPAYAALAKDRLAAARQARRDSADATGRESPA